MTNHSIEELKRQYDAAYSRLTKARADEVMARHAYENARADATGFVGKLAVGRRYTILVKQVVFYGNEPGRVEGYVIKKDGMPGQRTGSVYLSNNPTFEDFK